MSERKEKRDIYIYHIHMWVIKHGVDLFFGAVVKVDDVLGVFLPEALRNFVKVLRVAEELVDENNFLYVVPWIHEGLELFRLQGVV